MILHLFFDRMTHACDAVADDIFAAAASMLEAMAEWDSSWRGFGGRRVGTFARTCYPTGL